MKYEVGKKYKSEASGIIFLCVAIDIDGKAIFKNPNHGNLFYVYPMGTYTEYKEPKRGTVWVNIYENASFAFRTKDGADRHSSSERLACVEVPWVEGQGLE